MKWLFRTLLILLFPITVFAQDTTVLKHQAQSLADATIKEHYEVVVDHTYPKLVTAIGGKDKMIAAIKQGMEMIKAQGFTISSITVGSPGKFYKAGTEIHCLLPQRMVLITPNARLVNNSNLLAISKDGGKFWYFIDINRSSYNAIPKLFPHFNKNLVVPEPTQPAIQ